MRKLQDSFTKNEILEIAREFKRRRMFLGLSQLKLSYLANLSQSIINKFESGKIDPTYSTVLKIEKALSEQETISNVKAKDIMVENIISVSEKTPIFKALESMRENDFSQLLVMEGDKLRGTIYEKSILDAIKNKKDINKIHVNEILEPCPMIIPVDYNCRDLSYIFQNRKTKFVLVGDIGEISGLITKSDLFKN